MGTNICRRRQGQHWAHGPVQGKAPVVRYPAYIATNGGDNGTTTGGYYGGPGSGGMIHLQALRVTVTTISSGGLQALGQQNVAGYNDFSSPGRIRVGTDLWNGGYTNPLALVGPLVQVPRTRFRHW